MSPTSTYKCRNQDLYVPSDFMDIAAKERRKDHLYCFIAAILDSPTLYSKWFALYIFTGGATADEAPKDYHSIFNHVYYVKWFEGLLTSWTEKVSPTPSL
ncbi:hypothetical protein DYB26_014000 [Aphanomyces astaci]|uniref:Uncharacterized protein n=1 Tax=Aphanomyces astaci TaxID=112090 RepID=A0A418E6S8_APHAT|nr:hypothetical protein DYB26_014000 [Aphanomyces astaci]